MFHPAAVRRVVPVVFTIEIVVVTMVVLVMVADVVVVALATADLHLFMAYRFLRVIRRLVGLVVKASASRAEDPGFESRLRPGFFRGRVIPVTSELALEWLPCQAPGVIGSVLGLVGPVSVYCDCVRWKV